MQVDVFILTEFDCAASPPLQGLYYKLRPSKNAQFFTEWMGELPGLNENEILNLQRLKHRYLSYMEEDEISEGTVNIIMLHPLLDVMGLCDLPLRIRGEKFLKIEAIGEEENEAKILQGRIDALVVRDRFWIVIIESKEYGFSVSRGVPQTLAYMMGNPFPETPIFGMITNGEEYIFIKVVRGEINEYGLSDLFSISNSLHNGLTEAMQVLKQLVIARD